MRNFITPKIVCYGIWNAGGWAGGIISYSASQAARQTQGNQDYRLHKSLRIDCYIPCETRPLATMLPPSVNATKSAQNSRQAATNLISNQSVQHKCCCSQQQSFGVIKLGEMDACPGFLRPFKGASAANPFERKNKRQYHCCCCSKVKALIYLLYKFIAEKRKVCEAWKIFTNL